MKEWGVKGQMKALPLTNKFYYLSPENEVAVNTLSGISETKKIKSLKKMNKYALVSFYGINDPETALKYRGAIISADINIMPALDAEEYFYDQIIGLTVSTTDGDILGRVSDIFQTGSNDIYVVKGAGKEYLIPAIHDVIKEIDIENKSLLIQVLEGLLD